MINSPPPPKKQKQNKFDFYMKNRQLTLHCSNTKLDNWCIKELADKWHQISVQAT